MFDVDVPEDDGTLAATPASSSASPTGTEDALDYLTRLASRILGVPVAQVTQVQGGQIHVLSSIGVPETFAAGHGIPLDGSLTQHILQSGQTMAAQDLRDGPLPHTLLVSPLGLVSCIGVPLAAVDGPAGMLLVCDTIPREWTRNEIATAEEIAALAAAVLVHREPVVSGAPGDEPSMEEGVVFLDAGGCAQDIDPSAEGLLARFGWDPARRAPLWDTVAPRLAEPLRAACARALRQRATASFRASLPDGGICLAGRIHPADGGLSVRLANVTQREGLERALSETRRRAETIVDSALDCIICMDAEGRVTEFNPSAERILGYPRADVLGRRAMDLFVPDLLREGHSSALAAARQDPACDVIARQVETVAMRADGSEFPCEVTVTTLHAAGTVSFIAFLRDISERKAAEREVQRTHAELERRVEERTRALKTLNEALEQDIACRKQAEAALRASTTRYRRLMETAMEGICVLDAKGRMEYTNPPLSGILGYTAEEMHGHSLADFVPRPTRREVARFLRQWREGRRQQQDILFQHKDGRSVWALASASPILGEDGDLMGGLVMVTDITERKQAEEKLTLLSSVARESPTSIIITNTEDRIVFINPAFERQTGYSLQEVLGKDPSEFIYGPLTAPETLEQVMQAIRNREPITAEISVRRKDGTPYYLELRLAPVFDLNGACTHWIGIGIDITQRKEAEQALRDNEERFRALVEDGADIVHVLDAEGNITYSSPSAGRLTGRSHSEFRGATSFQYIHPEDVPLVRNAIQESAATFGSIRNLEFRVRHVDGSYRYVSAAARNMLHRPEVNGIVIHLRDVTEAHEAAAALRESEARNFAMLRAMPDLLFRLRRDGVYLSAVASDPSLLLAPPDELIGHHIREVCPPEIAEQVVRSIECALKTGTIQITEYDLAVDDSLRTFESRAVACGPDEALCIVRDISERKQAEENLHRYRLATHNAHDVMLFVDATGNVLEVNEAAIRTYGYSREALLSMNVRDLHAEETAASAPQHIEKALAGSCMFETLHRRKDGGIFPVEVSAQSTRVGDQTVLFGVIRDISERKALEDQLLHQALHDPLTGLPNRALFKDRLRHGLSRRMQRGGGLAVLFLDLDRFKLVNDSLGHQAGDRLLVAAAGRLRSCLRQADTAARFGGDEFTILLEDVPDEGEAVRIAQRLLRKFQMPFEVDDQEVFVSASIGIALTDGTQISADDILRHADVAMYEAKGAGRGRYAVYRREMSLEARERLQLETDLRRAIEREQFRVHYQPIVLMETGRVIGVEALVRWQHPRYGLMPPDEFVPLQEQIGLIEPFTMWVLREAMEQCQAWHRAGYHLSVSVNLSRYNLHEPGFAQRVAGLLEETGLPPSWLKLEITESAVMMNPAQALSALQRFSDMGMRLSMDDFGTGYSSLSYLKQLPIQEVKIDKSFVMGMDRRDEDDSAIVRAIIDLAHNLRKKVVAEGVESREVWDLLNILGCDAAQGFHMARPMPADDLLAWLQSSNWGLRPEAALPSADPTILFSPPPGL